MKAVISALTDVHEALRGEYEPHGDAFRIKVEGDLPGFVPALKHAEFRDNNIKLLKSLGAESVDAAIQRATLFAGIDPAKLERLKAIDPDEYAALKAKVTDLEKTGVKKPDDVQAAIKAALDGFKASELTPLQAQLAEAKKREATKDARLSDAMLREAVAQRFSKAGGRSDAGVLDYILGRAREAFRVVDEKVVAVEGKYGANGEALTVDEWIAGAAKEHAFAFEPSKGGGAAPVGSGAAHRQPAGSFRTSDGAEIKTTGISVLQ